MSKFVKDLVSKDLSRRLDGVTDAILVNVIGLNAQKTYSLRKRLREKNISLLVVKNSLAQRATEGTALRPAFEGAEGTLAIVWGGSDVVSLAKEVTKLAAEKDLEGFQARGGVMDGERLTPEAVKQISTWPSREEQLSMLVGQILGPGRKLSAALLGPGRALASQVKKKSESEGAEAGEAASEAAPA
jgi:ribosomal protein L10